jgi:hypothetical protein
LIPRTGFHAEREKGQSDAGYKNDVTGESATALASVCRDVPERDRDALLADLHDHLAATAELPIDRDANRWIGEAEAVAADLATNDLSPETVEERVGHVRDLLTEVEATEHPEADDHVAAARDIAARLLEGT